MAVIVVALLALFFVSVATDSAYSWPTYRRHIFDREFGRAALVTLELTGIATAIALVLGAVLASMRVSGNVVLRAVSWAYLSVSVRRRCTLQLVFYGLFTELYGHIGLRRTRCASPGQRGHHQDRHCVRRRVRGPRALGRRLSGRRVPVLLRIRPGQPARIGADAGDVTAGAAPPGALATGVAAGRPGHVFSDRIATTVKVSALVVAVPLTTDLYGRSVKTAELVDQGRPLLLCAATWYAVIVSAILALRWLVVRRMNRGPRAASAGDSGGAAADVELTHERHRRRRGHRRGAGNEPRCWHEHASIAGAPAPRRGARGR